MAKRLITRYHPSSSLSTQPFREWVGVDCGDCCECFALTSFDVDRAAATVECWLAVLDVLASPECPASYHFDSAAMKDNYYCWEKPVPIDSKRHSQEVCFSFASQSERERESKETDSVCGGGEVCDNKNIQVASWVKVLISGVNLTPNCWSNSENKNN